MVQPRQNTNGTYSFRKRLPADVRVEYGRLYGASHEAKFTTPSGTKPHAVKQLFGDWLSEVEGRIAAIRAERKGVSLTR